MLPKLIYRTARLAGLNPAALAMRSPFKIREFETVVRQGSLAASARVLDFGCGSGPQTVKLAEYCREVVGIDVSREAIGQANALAAFAPNRSKVRFLCGDLFETAFPSGHFDAVLSFCVMEHLADSRGILAELSRITKPGGALHISVDSLSTISDAEVVAKHRRDHQVIQYFNPEHLRDELEGSGWQVSEIVGLHKGPVASHHFSEFVKAWPNRRRVRELISAPWLYAALRREDREIQCEDRGIMLVARASNRGRVAAQA
jgi:2-polyprenyl-3-methyl-5-hydroxy-6-metoxy-1,4-benzoquinol methylase